MTDCSSTSNTTVECITPRLNPGSEGSPLTYSLMFGNAVVASSDDLTITVVPNPFFADNALITMEITEGDSTPVIEIEVGNTQHVWSNQRAS